MGCVAAAAVLFSDPVMEVQAGHFHSSPTHKGHPRLKKGSFEVCLFFNLKLRIHCQYLLWMSLTTNADRVPASCSYTAHGHPPERLHCPGLLLRGEASVPQLTMTVELTYTHTKDKLIAQISNKDRRVIIGSTCPVPRCTQLQRH